MPFSSFIGWDLGLRALFGAEIDPITAVKDLIAKRSENEVAPIELKIYQNAR